MAVACFPLPETVDLKTAVAVAEDLRQHIRNSTTPVVATDDLRQGGVPLLQLLVAARKHAASLNKTFAVRADADGVLARLLTTYGLDPTLCGAPADLVPSRAAPFPEGEDG